MHEDAHSNLGNALRIWGGSRRSHRQLASKLCRVKPDYANAYNNLGIALMDKGKFDEAIASYQQALRLCNFNNAAAYQQPWHPLEGSGPCRRRRRSPAISRLCG